MKNITNRETIKQLIISISGRDNIIAIPTIYVRALDGDIVEAMLLSQLIYWSDLAKRKDGYFYHSYKDWENELCLSQYQVSRAVNRLKKRGLVETKLMKAEGAPTLHYKINLDAITDFIEKYLTIFNPLSRNLIIDYQETSQSMDYQETSQSLTETETRTKTLINTDKKTVGEIPDDKVADIKGHAPPIPKQDISPPVPPSKHPAVIAYKRVLQTQRNPNRVQMASIVDTVKDIPLWEDVIRHWLGHGWNPANISGMLESYRNGGAKACNLCNRNGNRKKNGAQKAIEYPDDEFAEFARANPGKKLPTIN